MSGQKPMSIWLDGKLVPKEQAVVSVFDHGLLYGDGVFEGIRIYNRRVFRLDGHLDRLYDSAKAIALARNLPLIGVNHLVGHLLSAQLRRAGSMAPQVEYPFIALLVSGGHTALYEVRSPTDMAQLGQTRDDAAGEAFDKVAKLLGLGYPGGPRVDRLAALGDPSRIKLPRPLRRPAALVHRVARRSSASCLAATPI